MCLQNLEDNEAGANWRQSEHTRVFGRHLKGEDVDLCLPVDEVPDKGLEDFTACQS